MKRNIWMILIVAFVVASAGCQLGRFAGRGITGSGKRKTEKRELKSFSSIDTSGAFEVNITCQKAATFEIEADDNILPLIKTEVRDGILFVTNTDEYRPSKSPALRISVPELTSVANHGAGKVTIADANSADLKIDSSGAASIEASGKAKAVKISSSGAGNIDTGKLTAETATIDATGAANVEVYASEQLDVHVSGVGTVTYSGNPKVVNKNISGIGSVNPKD